MTERSGKAAFVWVLGQFGEHVPEAPYILEKVIEEEATQSATDLDTFLVVAITRLFFKRAPEVKPIMQKFYSTILKTSLDQDLKQRVVLYYRLLSQNVQTAERVINHQLDESLADFHEDKHSEKRERLFMEFNTLSVVYGRPSETFLKDAALKQSVAAEKKYYPKERGFKTSDQEKLLQDQPAQETDLLLDMGGEQASQAAAPQQQPVDLLSGDLLGLDMGGPAQPVPQSNGSGGADLLGGFGAPE